MKIFLATEVIPSTPPEEQMWGGPEEWVGRWSQPEGHLGAMGWITRK